MMNLLAQTLVSDISHPLMTAGWYLLALIGMLLCALLSGAEIGLYSLSRVRLRLRVHRHDSRALMLSDWLNRPTYALEALLILQNVAGFIFSATVTHILTVYQFSSWAQALVSTALITPLMLIFAEVVPKDLFNTNADRWTYRLVPFLKWSFRAITVVPLLPVVRLLSRVSVWLVNRGRPRAEIIGPRTEILSLFQESTDTGVLTHTQQDLVQRALRLARINVRDVMTPWNRVVAVPNTISREGFRAFVRRYNFSRIPVLGRSTTDVLGIIEALDVLAATRDPKLGERMTLEPFATKPMTLIGEQSVRSAITLMQRARQTIAIVVDLQGRAIGMVTIKDLVEELVGDLEAW